MSSAVAAGQMQLATMWFTERVYSKKAVLSCAGPQAATLSSLEAAAAVRVISTMTSLMVLRSSAGLWCGATGS